MEKLFKHLGLYEFQSTSVIADGRICRSPTCQTQSVCCFNPRPSLLTDESQGLLSLTSNGNWVSIHVRHC